METLDIGDYHSPRQRRDIELAARAFLRGKIGSQQVLRQVMSQSVKHGLDEFTQLEDRFILQIEATARTRKYHSVLRQEYQKVRQIQEMVPPSFLKNLEQKLLVEFAPTFIQGRNPSTGLIIIFLTSLNNFYLSNAVMAIPLLEKGYSLLFLKTERNSQFLNGIPGFGDTWSKSMGRLREFLKEKSLDYRVTGFSSSGYASILATLTLDPSNYVGFSVYGDLRLNSHLQAPRYFNKLVRNNTPVDMHRNLVQEAHGCKTPIKLFAGELNTLDVRHAEAFRSVKSATVEILPDGSHMTARDLFLADRFFAELIA